MGKSSEIDAIARLAERVLGAFYFFFSSRRRHTRYWRDWSSDVCSSDLWSRPQVPGQVLLLVLAGAGIPGGQRGDEGLLRHLHAADHLHPLLAFLLLLEQLALPADVTAVALREDVLADRPDRLAGDDPAADGGLDRHLELLPRDELLQLRRDRGAVRVRLVLVHDRAERVDRLAVQQDVDLDEVGDLLAGGLVVEAGVAAGTALQVGVAVRSGERRWRERGAISVGSVTFKKQRGHEDG